MAFGRIFKERPGVAAGKRLYAAAVEQARVPQFYAHLGVGDTVMGRFELYTLHTVLLVLRLKGRGSQAAEVAQALFDAYLEGLDIALREMGVGDLSVGKKMKKLGRAFYGRVGSWEAALAEQSDEARALIVRTVYEGVDNPGAVALAAYARDAHKTLAELGDAALLSGETHWPGAPS